MSALTPDQIAAWHREEALKHLELAKFHRKTADTILPLRAEDRKPHHREEPNGSNVELTLAQLEKSLQDKGGRVNHLAARLGCTEERIWDLLKEPACQWEVGERGFIYRKKTQ